MAEDGQAEPKSRRIRKQTSFFRTDAAKKKEIQRLSMDIGEQPSDLKSIIKDPATPKTPKTIRFGESCQIALITPLPGWDPLAIRLDDFAEEEDAPTKPAEARPHRMFQNLEITPTSLAKLQMSQMMGDTDDARVEFNAKFLFNSLEDSTTDSPNSTEEPINTTEELVKKRSRRKSAVKLAKEALAAILTEHETSDVEKTTETAECVPTLEPRIYVHKGKERILKPPRSRTKARVTDWLMKTPEEGLNSTLMAERTLHDVAYEKPASSVSESSFLEKAKEKRKAARPPKLQAKPVNEQLTRTTKSASAPSLVKTNSVEIISHLPEREMAPMSPEIITLEVVESKERPNSLKRKNTLFGEMQQAKRGLFDPNCTVQSSDVAPIPRVHCLDAIVVPEKLGEYPEVRFVLREDRVTTSSTAIFLPDNELSPEPSFIQLFDATKKDEKSQKSYTREWLDIFTECDVADSWTAAFTPKTSKQWLGDSSTMKKARNFVKKWKARVARDQILFVSSADKKESTKFRKNSEESDCGSDYEDEDIIQANPLIICGPAGSGKTALIASLAAEFSINILEVHPGDKRNAAALKQKFDGAIKNQAVQQKSGSIATFFGTSGEKKETTSSRQNLVVVEHVDISFEDDKDFWPTIKALAAESRVPMIWTCERLPTVDIYREPALDSFEQINVDYCSSSLLAKYIQCCLLLTRKLTAPLPDLEQYVRAFNCDLRRIFADLQIQTADGSNLKLFLPISSKTAPTPLVCDRESTYRSRQEYTSAKKSQYQHIFDELKLVKRSISAPVRLIETATALDRRLPSSSLATDYLPYLAEMDKPERIKATQSRRYLHYFKEVRPDTQIDRNGQLLTIVRQMSFL